MTEFIEGLDELKINLRKVEGAVSGAGLVRALNAGAFVAEGEAKRRAAVDTGFMRGAIQAQPALKTARGAEATIAAAAEYSVHLEFGTSKMAAQPFMRPAIKEGKANIQRAVSNVLAAEINNAVR